MHNRVIRYSWLLAPFACQPAAPPQVSTPITPAISAPTMASAARPAPPPEPAPRAELHPIMFAGHRAPQNVVWTKGGFAIATHDELWRVLVRNELLVQTAKLSRPLGHEAAMGASSGSLVVGLGLDDGSVDIFRGATRLRTIAG